MVHRLSRPTNRLEPAELEDQFRRQGLSRDIGAGSALLLISALFALASIPLDRTLLGSSPSFFAALTVRVGSAVIALVVLYLIRQKPEVDFFDAAISVWTALLLLGVLTANALLPPDYTIHLAWDLLFTLAVYSVVPLPLNRQVALALLFTLGVLVLCFEHKVLEPPGATMDISLAFVCANMIGGFTAWALHRWRRQQFLAFQRESEIRSDLEQTLRELKTLRGIIPICSNCKSIRTQGGDWKEVAAYVRDHSHAEFSHGICPDCQRELYPEFTSEDEG